MYFVEKILDDLKLNIEDLPSGFDIENSVFFDIETSGLSPHTSFVFLIGLMFWRDDRFIVRQYFANNADEETEILNNFIQDIMHFETIYHYNGLSFDIPYINSRLIHHNIRYQLPKENSFDIYQYLRKNKELLNLENLKLKSIEKHLGIYRKDDMSGQEVSDGYKSYLINKDNNYRNKILLHNIEDIINLYYILPIINTTDTKVINKKIKLSVLNYDINIGDKNLTLLGKFDSNLKQSIEINNNYFMLTLNIKNNSFNLKFNIIEDEIYYHIDDYKNYYYIPEIDSVIHKSVLKYYDYSEKIRANKDNCYTKQIDKYIHLPFSPDFNDVKLLSQDKKIQRNCILIKEISKIINPDNISTIIKHIIEQN